jgi:vitamin B12 transporter
MPARCMSAPRWWHPRRFDDAARTRRMGGYALLNLTAEYRFGNRWTLFARLDNAFDKHYELAADFNTAGARCLY